MSNDDTSTSDDTSPSDDASTDDATEAAAAGHDEHEQDEQGGKRKPQLTVSEAGSSFSDPETSQGGADAVPGTPDGVLRRNRSENETVDDDLLA